MSAALRGAAEFFSKTWKQRFNLGGEINKATGKSALTRIIGESRAQRSGTVEQVIRKELLDTMADLSAQKISVKDKKFDEEVTPVLRTLGKLIGQKDQTKFFKQLKDFKQQMQVLEQQNKSVARTVEGKVDFDRAEEALEDIVKLEKEGFGKTQLGGDLRRALTITLGPAAPFVHMFEDLKRNYGKTARGMLDKIREYAANKAEAGEAYAQQSRWRWKRFNEYSGFVTKKLNREAMKAFFARMKSNGIDLLKTAGSFLFSRRGLMLGAGALGIGRALLGHHGNSTQSTSGHNTDTGTAVSTPIEPPAAPDTDTAPSASASKDDGKDAAKKGSDLISDATSSFTDWFLTKWGKLSAWMKDNPITDTLGDVQKGITENKQGALGLINKIITAPMRVIGSVFRTIYGMLPEPIQKGIDWAIKMGGEPLKFFSRLLSGELVSDMIDQNQAASATPVAQTPATNAAASGIEGATKPQAQGQYPGLKLQPGADIEGLQGDAKSKLLAMAAEYFQMTGKNLQINTAKRSYAEQVALYTDGKHKAAKPGTSMHEYGYAIDMHSADANALASMGLLRKYGFARPVKGEPWHLEPESIQNRKGEIRKQPPGDAPNGAALASNPGGGGRDVRADTAKVAPLTEGGFSAGPIGKGRPAKDKEDEYRNLPISELASAQPKGMDFARVPSRSKKIEKVIDEEDLTGEVSNDTMASKDSMNSLSFYIGDFDFLHLNFGMADAS